MSKSLFLLGAIIVGISALLPGQSAWGDSYLSFELANDIFYLPIKTDQYFTHGLQLEFGKRKRKAAPLRVSGGTTVERYWRLTQNIYTPREIGVSHLVENDRPFASYLLVTRGKFFTDDQLGFGLRWELSGGILGRHSGGGRMQNALHDMLSFTEPLPGWGNEVNPDVLLNYELGVSQRFSVSPRFGFTTTLTGRLGTLYTNLRPELKFSWLAIRTNGNRTLRFDLFSNARIVAYDATLTGGLFNRDERYRGRIRPKRLVGLFGFDGVIDLGKLQLSGGLRHLGVEFSGGLPHAWAWFSVGVQPGRLLDR